MEESMTDIFKTERQRFPILKKYAYLKCASTGPIPDYVYNSVNRYQQDRYFLGGDSSWDGMGFLQMLQSSKESLGQMLHCSAEDIAFGPNSSALCNIFIHGLNIQPGENVILSDMAFISGRFSWQFAEQKGVELRFLPTHDGMLTPECIEKAIDEKTRAVFLCHVESATGFRHDIDAIGKICRSKGVWFGLDCAQSAGAFPIDVDKQCIDFLAGNDYKWMLHYSGCGFAYISDKLRQIILPYGAGWMSDSYRFDTSRIRLTPRKDAGKYEFGFPCASGVRALGLVAERNVQLGAEQIKDRILGTVGYLYQQIKSCPITELVYEFPKESRSGIVYFRVNDDPEAIKQRFMRDDVQADIRPQPDGTTIIRAGIHYYNSNDDIDRLMSSIGSK